MHPALARQLQRLGLDQGTPPADQASWQELLSRLDAAYNESDANRYLLERSLQVSSREMHELTRHIEETNEQDRHRLESHYRRQFSRVPIALWEQDYTAVAAWLEGLQAAGVGDLRGHLNAHPEELRRGVSLINVTDVNQAAAELNGLMDRSMLLGPIKVEMLDEESVRSFIGQFEAIWRGDTSASYEFSSSTFSGDRLEALFYWLVDSRDGLPDYSNVLVTIVDVTALKLAEERLAAQIATKDRFLASVSHELRTPLTGVVAASEMLRQEWRDLESDLVAELLETVAREGGELAAMIDDLLVAARSEISRVNLAPQMTSLCDVVREVAAAVRPDDAGKDVLYEYGEVDVYGDPLRIRQIVRNLLTNAIRYGGPRVSVRTKGAGDRRFLTIDDDGPGVPDERRETIFNPYETAHARNGQPGSVGLGLTVARQLARLMDGELRYERKNSWTRFTLDMPAQPTSNDATRGGSGPSRRAGHVQGAAALSEAGNRG